MAHPLADFLAQLTVSAKDEFASACRATPESGGTSLQYLRHIAAGRKRPSVELCAAIERASAGAVRCEALRPDVDWDYLAQRRVSP